MRDPLETQIENYNESVSKSGERLKTLLGQMEAQSAENTPERRIRCILAAALALAGFVLTILAVVTVREGAGEGL